jgi:hypothetical protein
MMLMFGIPPFIMFPASIVELAKLERSPFAVQAAVHRQGIPVVVHTTEQATMPEEILAVEELGLVVEEQSQAAAAIGMQTTAVMDTQDAAAVMDTQAVAATGMQAAAAMDTQAVAAMDTQAAAAMDQAMASHKGHLRVAWLKGHCQGRPTWHMGHMVISCRTKILVYLSSIVT